MNFTDGRKIEYVYDAFGYKLTMKTYKAGPVLVTTTDYVNGFVYQNSTLSFFSSPEGRVVKKGGTLEYQYAIKDHLGNTRVIFSSINQTDAPVTATFEDAVADAQVFKNVNTSTAYWVPKPPANNTPSGQYVIRMNNTYKTGPAKSLSVFPGDIVELEVWAYYEGTSGFGGSNQSVGALITSVIGALANGLPAGEVTAISNGVNSAYTTFGAPGNLGDSRPTAYLNYILLDKNYKLLDMGWKPVPSSANMTKQKISFLPKNIAEPGFMYVYLSYEGEGTNWVYFDDLKISHIKSNVVQYNEYYPFGLQTNASWTREGATGNNYLYNEGSELNPTTGWYEMMLRNYDPAIGRMNGIDPRSAKYALLTTYNYAFNNPIRFNDPTGGDPGQDYAAQAKAEAEAQAAEWAILKQQILQGNSTTVSVNGVSAQVDFNEIGEVIGFVNAALSSPAQAMETMQNGYIQITTWYYDQSGNPTTVDGCSGYGMFIHLEGNRESAQQGSDWTNAVQFGLTTGEFFRNLKSYEYNGTHARRAVNLLDDGNFLNNGKVYSNKFYGNQYIGKAGLRYSKSAFQQSTKYLKGAGRALGAVNIAVTGYQVVGDLSEGKYYSAGARVAVATIAAGAAFIPVVGWGITIGIGVADAIWGDEFYNYVENKMGN